MEVKVKEGNGSRVVRLVCPSHATARQWVGEQEDLAVRDNRILRKSMVKRQNHGARYEGEVVSVTVEWIRQRHDARSAKQLENNGRRLD